MVETYAGWIAVDIELPAGVSEGDERLEELSSLLFELGAGGLELRDAERPPMMVASFAPGHDAALLAEAAAEALAECRLAGGRVGTRLYEAIDWSTHWRQHFHPMGFGAGRPADEQLWVVPTWLEKPAGARHVLWIDPSSAFGTGLHPTTALCLERVVELSPVKDALDVGTGTGILALAALQLGAEQAVGTDNDPEALRVARENAERNPAGARLELSARSPRALGRRFALVLANILARPLVELAPELAAAVAPGGELVLSGLIVSQVEEVAAAYQALGFRRRQVCTREEWARIDLVGP